MDENKQAEEVQEEVAEEAQTTEDTTDWKAEARKWEARAKENKDAAAELEKIRQERMTESEKLQARAEKAEAELSRITAENERIQAAKEVSQSTEVPLDLLMFCSNKEAMEQFAQVYAQQNTQVHAAPKKQASRIVRDTETPTGTRDVFAEMMSNML